ncbi:MAG: YbaB/EbfC family nucleoid-associated protein [Patescibacteria group bacterium]
MFNKIKQFKDLRDQAKTLQNSLSQQSVTVEKSGVTLVLDGNQEIRSLTINPKLTPAELEKIIPPLFKEANDKVKRLMAQTMQSMGGFNFPGM